MVAQRPETRFMSCVEPSVFRSCTAVLNDKRMHAAHEHITVWEIGPPRSRRWVKTEFRSKGSRQGRAALFSFEDRHEPTVGETLSLSQVRRCVWVVRSVLAIRLLISGTCRAVLPSGRLVRPARWTEGRCSASRVRQSRETSKTCCR